VLHLQGKWDITPDNVLRIRETLTPDTPTLAFPELQHLLRPTQSLRQVDKVLAPPTTLDEVE
jgi:hypothetical protein